MTLGPCTYCGFCEWFGCGNYSKASPQTTILPVLVRRPNFEARTLCEVLRINLDGSGKRATGVTYVDYQRRGMGAAGRSGAALRLPALQRASAAASRASARPTIRNTGQGVDRPKLFLSGDVERQRLLRPDKNFNPFIASGAIGICIDEFNGDNFDHGPLGFVGGGYMGAVQTNGRPILGTILPTGHAEMGRGVEEGDGRRTISARYRFATHGSCYSYRDAYLDLDPTYTDRLGRKLLRITFDFHQNELKMSQYLTDRLAEIVQKMGAEIARQEAAHRALHRRRIPDDAYLRRRGDGRRSQDQRRQPLSPELGRVQSLRHWARRTSRRMPATTRRARSARSHSGRPMRSSINTSSIPGRWCRHEARSAPLFRVVLGAALLGGGSRCRDLAKDEAAHNGQILSMRSRAAAISRPRRLRRLPYQAGRQALCRRPGRSRRRSASSPVANITPDRRDRHRRLERRRVRRRVAEGQRRDGARLYPAMPYPYFTKMTRDDVLAIRAYLDTIEPVHKRSSPNQLPFPFNIRIGMLRLERAVLRRHGRFSRDPENPPNGIAAPISSKGRAIAAPATRRRISSAATRRATRCTAAPCRAGTRPT